MGNSDNPRTEGDNWTITTIAENWCQKDGEDRGQCEGCPAHWEHHPDDGFDVDDPPPDGAAPSYGNGQSKNLEKVRIVIMGLEPGIHKEEGDSNSICEDISERIYERDIQTKGVNAGSLGNASPLFESLNEETAYWTQAKKCNEITSNKYSNNAAMAQCVGFGPYEGYLEKELRVVNPDYVVTLGKDTHKICIHMINEITNSNRSWKDERCDDESWSELVANNNEYTGKFGIFNYFDNANIDFQFKLIPIPHPAYGIHQHTSGQFEENELEEEDTITKSYFKKVGQGLAELLNS